MADRRSTSPGEERRENFRVSESALVAYESLGRDEAVARRAMLQRDDLPAAFALSSRMLELRQHSTVLRRHAQQESATFAKLVEQIDSKLDLFAEVLMLQSFEPHAPELVEVDLGAEGMGLLRDRPMSVGRWLDLRVQFRSTGLGLRTFGEIVHCEAIEDGRYTVGLHFRFIREFDSELLVHQVLTRQAILLRERAD